MEKIWIRDVYPGSATLVLTWDPNLDPDLKMISIVGSGSGSTALECKCLFVPSYNMGSGS
jgi:hypothetical protein